MFFLWLLFCYSKVLNAAVHYKLFEYIADVTEIASNPLFTKHCWMTVCFAEDVASQTGQTKGLHLVLLQ